MKGWIGVHLTPLDIYPVGSIYLSTAATNPGTLFGGTWQAIEGRFLLAAGGVYAAGSTGGEAAHTLTIEEMPIHHHLWAAKGWPQGEVNPDWLPPNKVYPYRYVDNSISIYEETTQDAGGGQSHNNMPPYLVVYVWKRTA